MKKLTAIFALLLMSTLTFAQLQIVNQKELILNREDEISVIELGKKGFVLLQKTKSEESKKLKTWIFTQYSPELEVVWKKELTLDRDQEVLDMGESNGDINILYSAGSVNTGINSITAVKVDSEGEIAKKEFPFLKRVYAGKGTFIGGNYYFTVAVPKYSMGTRSLLACCMLPMLFVNVAAIESFDMYKIDLNNMAISKNKLQLPEYCSIVEQTTDGEKMYSRVKSYKKKVAYDAIYTFEDGVVMEKTPIKIKNNTEIEKFSVVMPDTAHKFVLGLSKNEVVGATKKKDKYFFQYYLSNLNNEDLQTINKVDKKISDELLKRRDVEIKNSFWGGNYQVMGNNYILSSCFRTNNKNFMVFDNYQEIYSEHTSCDGKGNCRTYYVFESYYYTHTIVWCFNDEGEVEWTKNFEYDIISPILHAKTCCRPYKDNTIALIGHFDNELSYKLISMDGEVVEGTEKQKVSNRTKFKDLKKFNNSITHLYDNTYLVWGNDRDDKSEEGASKNKKKEKRSENLNLILKIVDFQ